VSGGDIKNGILKAAALAAAEEGPDLGQRIKQQDFEYAIEEVVAAKTVMRQSLFADTRITAADSVKARAMEPLWRSANFAALAHVLNHELVNI
jgi:hypothetical protein